MYQKWQYHVAHVNDQKNHNLNVQPINNDMNYANRLNVDLWPPVSLTVIFFYLFHWISFFENIAFHFDEKQMKAIARESRNRSGE